MRVEVARLPVVAVSVFSAVASVGFTAVGVVHGTSAGFARTYRVVVVVAVLRAVLTISAPIVGVCALSSAVLPWANSRTARTAVAWFLPAVVATSVSSDGQCAHQHQGNEQSSQNFFEPQGITPFISLTYKYAKTRG